MVEIRPASTAVAAAFVAHRSEGLGWGPPTTPDGRVAALSPRADPPFDASSPPCVSVYGDSVTQGSGVGDDETYPHQLATSLGCRVANYGVGGYGDDQSLLLARAQRDRDRAPVVVIGHTGEGLMRNVSRYRGFIDPGGRGGDGEPAFKPRFLRTADGRLATLAAPVTDERLLREFERHPDIVAIDAFADRPRRRFPYTLATASWLLNDWNVRTALARVPRYAPLHDPAHASDAFELTKAILVTFVREAEADGRRALVVLIPEAADVEYRRKTGAWLDRLLETSIAQAGVPVLRAELAGDVCELYAGCTGHLTAQGNARLAAAVAPAVRRAARGPAPR